MNKKHRDKYKRPLSPSQQLLAERRKTQIQEREEHKKRVAMVDPVIQKSQPALSILGNKYKKLFNESVEEVYSSQEKMLAAKERAAYAGGRANNIGLIARTAMQDLQTEHDTSVNANKMAKMAFQTDAMREQYEQKKLQKKIDKLDGKSEDKSTYQKAYDKEYKNQEAKRGAEDAVRQSRADQQNKVFENYKELHDSLLKEILKQLDLIIETNLLPDELQKLIRRGADIITLEETILEIVPDCPRREGIIGEIKDVMALYEARRAEIVDL